MSFTNSIQILGRYSRNLLSVLICWTVLGLSVGLAQETPLTWKFNKGDQFKVKTTKLSKCTSTLDSRISVVRSDVVIEFTWTVDSVDDAGNAVITQELTRFSINIRNPAVPLQAVAYASDDVPAELTSAMRKLQRKSKPMVGLKCILTMTSNGEITSVQLVPDSQKKLDKLSNAPNLQTLFSKKSLEKLSSDFTLNAVPPDATPTGWSKTEVQQGGFGKVSINHKFSIAPAETVGGRKLIDVNIVSSLTPIPADDTPKEIKAKNQISQSLKSYTGSGSITFNQDDGYFSGSQFQTKIKSKRQYREKLIMTSLEDESRIEIEKK